VFLLRSATFMRVITLLLAIGRASTLSARAWLTVSAQPLITGTASKTNLELGLLPFSSKPLLPGEERKLIFSEAESLAVLRYSAEHHESCCAQLMVRGEEVIGVTGLLEVSNRQTVGGAVQATLRCVGRVRLSGLSDRSPADGEPSFAIAVVEPYVDDDEDEMSEEDEVASALAAAVTGDEAAAEAAATRADVRIDAAKAAARAVAASAEANGVSPEEVVAAARELLANLDQEIHKSHVRAKYQTHAPHTSAQVQDDQRPGPRCIQLLVCLVPPHARGPTREKRMCFLSSPCSPTPFPDRPMSSICA